MFNIRKPNQQQPTPPNQSGSPFKPPFQPPFQPFPKHHQDPHGPIGGGGGIGIGIGIGHAEPPPTQYQTPVQSGQTPTGKPPVASPSDPTQPQGGPNQPFPWGNPQSPEFMGGAASGVSAAPNGSLLGNDDPNVKLVGGPFDGKTAGEVKNMTGEQQKALVTTYNQTYVITDGAFAGKTPAQVQALSKDEINAVFAKYYSNNKIG